MTRRLRPLLYLAAFALLTVGCSRRKVPGTFPKSSPASLSAEEARPMRVTRALDEHPPLPSEDTRGWKGLQQADESKTGGHEHHHHGAQHGAPARNGSADSGPAESSSAEKPVEPGHEGHAGPGDHKTSPPAEKPAQAPTKPDHSGHDEAPSKNEQAASYSCPMHPEVVSDKADRCPRCGMNLEKKP